MNKRNSDTMVFIPVKKSKQIAMILEIVKSLVIAFVSLLALLLQNYKGKRLLKLIFVMVKAN